jgi:hypothetical protein
VYVEALAQLPKSGEEGSWEALDAVVEAVEADNRTLGASVAGGEGGVSVYLSVDAESPTSARAVAEEIVTGALQKLGLEAQSSAVQAYDADGSFIE